MHHVWIIRSMFAKKDEAISAANTLLELKLIACANISEGVTSLFCWEGTLQQEQEVVLLAKTSEKKAKQALEQLKKLHSYQTPSILAWPASLADEAFSQWVLEETR